jgi:O-antigen ligase
MSDRIIANINDYKVNNDSASAITYTYLTSGILGLILFFYLYYNLIKVFCDVKIEKVQLSKIYIKSLILLILMRSLIENSFTVWGIDYCVLLLSIVTIEYYGKKVNKNNS